MLIYYFYLEMPILILLFIFYSVVETNYFGFHDFMTIPKKFNFCQIILKKKTSFALHRNYHKKSRYGQDNSTNYFSRTDLNFFVLFSWKLHRTFFSLTKFNDFS